MVIGCCIDRLSWHDFTGSGEILSLLRLFFAATGQLLDPASETYSIADRKASCRRIIKMAK
jgi:hypothetical protein